MSSADVVDFSLDVLDMPAHGHGWATAGYDDDDAPLADVVADIIHGRPSSGGVRQRPALYRGREDEADADAPAAFSAPHVVSNTAAALGRNPRPRLAALRHASPAHERVAAS